MFNDRICSKRQLLITIYNQAYHVIRETIHDRAFSQTQMHTHGHGQFALKTLVSFAILPDPEIMKPTNPFIVEPRVICSPTRRKNQGRVSSKRKGTVYTPPRTRQRPSFKPTNLTQVFTCNTAVLPLTDAGIVHRKSRFFGQEHRKMFKNQAAAHSHL